MRRAISITEALETTLGFIPSTAPEFVSLVDLVGRMPTSDLYAKVNSPSVDASLKDGYAVRSADVADAGPGNPITLQLAGHITAGQKTGITLKTGQTFRITTGSPIPEGADAVLSEEYASLDGQHVICRNTAESGRNVLARGTDIRKGECVARQGEKITPATAGLITTAGLDGAHVYKRPRVCVIATGDEVVAPGLPLPEGKLYASNVIEICAWLQHFGVGFQIAFAQDRPKEIAALIREHLCAADAFITSGGIWGSERDLMLHVLEGLNWQGCYHRVRMAPGKAVAFGLLENKPFFCLPGGPPSNEMAFLQIALPGLLRMSGGRFPPFPLMAATLTADVFGDDTWTQFIHAQLEKDSGGWRVTPLRQKSRLRSMACKNALIMLPEGCGYLAGGASITVQVLDSEVLCSA